MAKLTPKVKALIESVTPLVATCGGFGFPNITPKGSLRMVDDETLVFSELAGGKTYHNLKDRPALSVLVVDLENKAGYQIKGSAKLLDHGELFDAAVAQSKERNGRPPQYVVRVDVAEVWSIWPGQTDEPISA